jgi:D-alanyl-lipoteichoic acid acyltransferase DltB (MBOAT superfamily)
MLFHSFEFLFFVPVVFLGHALLRGAAWRWWLLGMSYLFYGWGHPLYVALLLISTALDFIVAQRLGDATRPAIRRAWLLASLVGNLGLLAAFKYLGFFARLLNRGSQLLSLGIECPVPELPLPPGISFYTFQTMAYTIDVYRRQMAPERRFSTMALYVAYFPQLVAGPIERAQRLMGQLAQKPPASAADGFAGGTRILWGLTKKLVFADWLALFVDAVYEAPGEASGGELLLATYAFAFQIYLDFSAYSDIAIGLGRAMGIRLQENFQWPYLARNLSEFWTRWHISLSTWLRDYLYIPLGGSRRGRARTIMNVFLVMFLGGLWHGAAVTFIAWGLWIALGLSLFQLYAGWTRAVSSERRTTLRWGDLPGILLTFHWLLLSWVFFRSDSVGDALTIFRRLAPPWGDPGMGTASILRTVWLVGLVALAHALRGTGLGPHWDRLKRPLGVGVLWGAMIVAMLLLTAPVQEPFIYFQF